MPSKRTRMTLMPSKQKQTISTLGMQKTLMLPMLSKQKTRMRDSP